MDAQRLWPRQSGGAFGDDDYDSYDGDGHDDGWWWTPAGMAVGYAIVGVLFGLILVYLLGGYYSTQRRIRRNQPPLPAFRWMVRRQQTHSSYYGHEPRSYFQQPQYTTHRPQHSMDSYSAPPPPYTNGEMPPPVYQPPQGASKALPDQNFHVAAAPAGEGSGILDRPQPPIPVVTRP